jgi:hypothetical protein
MRMQSKQEEDGTAGYEQSSCFTPGAPISLNLNHEREGPVIQREKIGKKVQG